MCGSMVDIQSATAEISRGKKKKNREKKPQDKNIMSASAMQGGHNYNDNRYSVTIQLNVRIARSPVKN